MRIHFGAAIVMVALGATTSFAGDLNDTIAETLDNLETQIDQARVWKFGIRPTFKQGVIWTDNVYLNDAGEQPFQLVGVTGPNGLITNPKKLRNIQKSTPDFQDLDSEGRVQDTILRTELGAALVLPINQDYSKFFKTDEITVLSAELHHHEYMHENELDSTDFQFSTDVFGFLSDMLDFEYGNRFWVRAGGDYSRLEEPLDTDIVELQQIGIASVDFRTFERTEWAIRADAGYRHNRIDGFVGAEYYQRRLADRELRQAEYDRTNLHAEGGYELPWFQDKRAFVRVDYDEFRPDDRAGDGSQQALNDGDRIRAVLGVDGSFLSKKIAGRVAAGYEAWDPDVDSGLSGDDSSFNAVVGEVELAYRPWEERNTQFQLSYDHTTDASAISNYNSEHRGAVSVSHELIPDTLDADMSFGVTRTQASEGPNSRLYDVGMGVTYHWFKQVDVSLRYSYRHSQSWNEIRILSSFSRNGRDYIYTSESDGDFYVNTVELALDVRF